jgi:hypothetical protein
MAGIVARGRPCHDLLCFVSGWLSAVVAVAGTLLGSVLTFVFQQRSSQQRHTWAFGDRLRGDRLASYGAFVTALAEFRRGQMDWFERRREDPVGPGAAAARAESYRLGGIALAALAQVELISDDPGLKEAAGEALAITRRFRTAEHWADVAALQEAEASAREAFVALPAAAVQAPPGAVPARRAGRLAS